MSSSRPPALLAPGALSSSYAVRLPSVGETLPAVDARIVMPETPFEVIDGQVYETMSANPPHALANGQLAYVLGGCVRPEFHYAVDMLMRANRYSDMAPDASVYPKGTNPETGGRQLEELVFEVKDTQDWPDLKRKARLFAERGVRRIFCVDVPETQVWEWSEPIDAWQRLGQDVAIEDATCLVRAIPVAALLDAAVADDAVAQGLVAKGNRVLRAREEAALDEGKKLGLQAAVFDLCEAYGIELTPEAQAQVRQRTVAELEALRAALKATKRWPPL